MAPMYVDLGMSKKDYEDAMNLEKLYSIVNRSNKCSSCSRSGVTHCDCSHYKLLCEACAKKIPGCRRIGEDRLKRFEIEKIEKKLKEKKKNGYDRKSRRISSPLEDKHVRSRRVDRREKSKFDDADQKESHRRNRRNHSDSSSSEIDSDYDDTGEHSSESQKSDSSSSVSVIHVRKGKFRRGGDSDLEGNMNNKSKKGYNSRKGHESKIKVDRRSKSIDYHDFTKMQPRNKNFESSPGYINGNTSGLESNFISQSQINDVSNRWRNFPDPSALRRGTENSGAYYNYPSDFEGNTGFNRNYNDYKLSTMHPYFDRQNQINQIQNSRISNMNNLRMNDGSINIMNKNEWDNNTNYGQSYMKNVFTDSNFTRNDHDFVFKDIQNNLNQCKNSEVYAIPQNLKGVVSKRINQDSDIPSHRSFFENQCGTTNNYNASTRNGNIPNDFKYPMPSKARYTILTNNGPGRSFGHGNGQVINRNEINNLHTNAYSMDAYNPADGNISSYSKYNLKTHQSPPVDEFLSRRPQTRGINKFGGESMMPSGQDFGYKRYPIPYNCSNNESYSHQGQFKSMQNDNFFKMKQDNTMNTFFNSNYYNHKNGEDELNQSNNPFLNNKNNFNASKNDSRPSLSSLNSKNPFLPRF